MNYKNKVHVLYKILLLIGFPFFLSAQVLIQASSNYNTSTGLFDTDSLRTLSIQFEDPNYDSILVANWYSESGLRLPATIELSNGIVLNDVAIRYKGNSTFFLPHKNNNIKLPFNIDINKNVKGQKLLNYKKIKLANSIFDPTMCKEIIGYEIYNRYLPSPVANFMKVNLQGKYLGLYINTESIDKGFLKKHFNENDGVLFKCDPIQQYGVSGGPKGNSDLKWRGNDSTNYYNHYKLSSDRGWSSLINMIDILNHNFEDLPTVLNIDRVLWAFAVNMTIANLDTYNGLYKHNYYLYKAEDGLFQMIPWDVSESFVAALLGHNSNQNALFEYDPFEGYASKNTPLAKLTAEPYSRYGKIYAAHIRTVLEESLILDYLSLRIDHLQDLVKNDVFNDPNAWFKHAFYSNVTENYVQPNFSTAGILNSAALRHEFLKNHIHINHQIPTITDLQISNHSGNSLVTVVAKNANLGVELMATISPFNSKFISHTMYDDGTHGDLISGDQIYSIPLPFPLTQESIKLYILAENEKSIALYPPRAEYEFYEYSPSTKTLNEPGLNENIVLYPNPTDNEVIVKSQGMIDKSFIISNSIGQLMMRGDIDLHHQSIDVSKLSEGTYYLKIGEKTVELIISR